MQVLDHLKSQGGLRNINLKLKNSIHSMGMHYATHGIYSFLFFIYFFWQANAKPVAQTEVYLLNWPSNQTGHTLKGEITF